MFKNYSGTIQCSICQSSQERQPGRRLESMKKNPSWAQVVLPPALPGKGRLARHSHYWEKKSSSMRPGRRLQSLLSEFFGQIHSLFCQNGYSCGVAVCCTVLKIFFTIQLPPDREQSPRPLQGTQKWDAEVAGYSLLVHQHQRLSVWGRLSAQFLTLPSSTGSHPVSPSPFKPIPQLADFKRFTNAWVSSMKHGPSVDRVDNRLSVQKWD